MYDCGYQQSRLRTSFSAALDVVLVVQYTVAVLQKGGSGCEAGASGVRNWVD